MVVITIIVGIAAILFGYYIGFKWSENCYQEVVNDLYTELYIHSPKIAQDVMKKYTKHDKALFKKEKTDKRS